MAREKRAKGNTPLKVIPICKPSYRLDSWNYQAGRISSLRPRPPSQYVEKAGSLLLQFHTICNMNRKIARLGGILILICSFP
jgi:hypothetical protein